MLSFFYIVRSACYNKAVYGILSKMQNFSGML